MSNSSPSFNKLWSIKNGCVPTLLETNQISNKRTHDGILLSNNTFELTSLFLARSVLFPTRITRFSLHEPVSRLILYSLDRRDTAISKDRGELCKSFREPNIWLTKAVAITYSINNDIAVTSWRHCNWKIATFLDR